MTDANPGIICRRGWAPNAYKFFGGVCPHAPILGRSCKTEGKEGGELLTHNHPAALDGRPQDPVVQQLLHLSNELTLAGPIRGGLQALGGH